MSLGIDSEWSNQESVSSKGIFHNRSECYLAELIMVNREPRLAEMPQFWNLPSYQQSYMGFVINLVPRIKFAGFKAVHNAIVKHNLKNLDDKADELIAQEIV